MIQCLLPAAEGGRWEAHLKELAGKKPLPGFSEIAVDFLHELSNCLMKKKSIRTYPEIAAVAFWLRRANINRIQLEFEDRYRGRLILPRGTVLHFAPSNVDTIFVYSWALSLLAGNANIIRLSQKRNESLSLLLDTINGLLEHEKYAPIRDRTLVVSYPHDRNMTELLSSYCQVRVIWGGDETVRTIRSVPLPPMSTELVFADRFSIAALSSDSINGLNSEDLSRLAHNFFNDAFWFQQMACSSPKLVCWIGDKHAVGQAKRRFWAEMEKKLEDERFSLPASLNMTRMSTAFLIGSTSAVQTVSSADFRIPLRIDLAEMEESFRELHCGAGLFLELELRSLSELAGIVSDKDQSLTYFGFTREQLTELVHSLDGRGIDRIVPVGQALSFNELWDGYHLLTYFSREIELR